MENGLGRLDRNFSSVPVVVHRVAQVGLRPEYRFELRLLIQTIRRLIQKRSGLCIRQLKTLSADALEVICVDDLNPVVKFISLTRGVSPYGRQFRDDDRTVFSHNLARHDLHMLRNHIMRLVEISVSVRRVNNRNRLVFIRHEPRNERRGRIQIAVLVQVFLGRFSVQFFGRVKTADGGIVILHIPAIELVSRVRRGLYVSQAFARHDLRFLRGCSFKRSVFGLIGNGNLCSRIRLKPRFKNRVLIQACLLVPVQFRLGQFRCELRVAGYPFIGLLSGYLVPANELIPRIRRGHRAGDRIAVCQLSGCLQNDFNYGWNNSAISSLRLVNRVDDRGVLIFIRHTLRRERRIHIRAVLVLV